MSSLHQLHPRVHHWTFLKARSIRAHQDFIIMGKLYSFLFSSSRKEHANKTSKDEGCIRYFVRLSRRRRGNGRLKCEFCDVCVSVRVKLWGSLAKTARKQEVFDVCQAACRFCLLYDDGRWKNTSKWVLREPGIMQWRRAAACAGKGTFFKISLQLMCVILKSFQVPVFRRSLGTVSRSWLISLKTETHVWASRANSHQHQRLSLTRSLFLQFGLVALHCRNIFHYEIASNLWSKIIATFLSDNSEKKKKITIAGY